MECLPQALGRELLEFWSHPHNTDRLWSAIAAKLGLSLSAQACWIAPAHSAKLGYWSLSTSLDELIVPDLELNLTPTNLTIISDLTNYPDSYPWLELAKRLGWHSLMFITTQVQGKVNGCIALGSFEVGNWTSSQQDTFEYLAMLLSGLFQQYHLQQELQSKKEYQSLLINLNQEIQVSSDFKTIFRLALTGIGKCLNLTRCLIVRLKYREVFLNAGNHPMTTPSAIVEVASYWSKTHPLKQNFPDFELRESPLLQKAWHLSPLPLVMNNADQDSQLKIPLFQDQQVHHRLFIPLINQKNNSSYNHLTLGFIILETDKISPWAKSEIEFAQGVATQVTTSLIHYQTLQQVNSLVEKQTAQLKWSLDVQGKLSEKLLRQLEEMQKLNKIKDEFIARLSDELRLPLANIKLGIAMLKLKSENDGNQRYFDILENECSKEIKLINDLLTLQQIKLEKLELTYQLINLKQIVEELVASLKLKYKDKQLIIVVNDQELAQTTTAFPFYSDPESIKRILNELLTNACKFSTSNSKIYLKIATRIINHTSSILINVTNVGIGISHQDKEIIFNAFERGQGLSNGSSQGTGLGLYLVKSLVGHLNGNIEVESEPIPDEETYLTTFTIILPQTNQYALRESHH